MSCSQKAKSQNFLNTGFLDQKDDLDGVIALISNLDYVISTSSSPSMFASALGIPTTIFSLKNLDFWEGLKNLNSIPFLKSPLIIQSQMQKMMNILLAI